MPYGQPFSFVFCLFFFCISLFKIKKCKSIDFCFPPFPYGKLTWFMHYSAPLVFAHCILQHILILSDTVAPVNLSSSLLTDPQTFFWLLPFKQRHRIGLHLGQVWGIKLCKPVCGTDSQRWDGWVQGGMHVNFFVSNEYRHALPGVVQCCILLKQTYFLPANQ